VTTARDELYAYATVAFRDYEVPEVVDRHVTRLIDAYRAEVLADHLPTWEVMYEPGNVSDYLIGYTDCETAAKGAAEAWYRSVTDWPGSTLAWHEQPINLPDDPRDRWLECVRVAPDGTETATGLAIHHRKTDTTPEETP
jgi:hypothetical protein